MKKVILSQFLAAALMLSVLLAGCGGSASKVETAALEGWQEFTIMRPDIADSATVDATVALRTAVEEKLGVKLKLGTDWVKRPEDVPVGTKEILIGATNRPESSGYGLKYHDFVVDYVNDRIVIAGGCGDAVLSGVNWFIENCITESLVIPAEPYRCSQEYPYEDVTIGGILLSDYAVESLKSDPNASVYNTLRRWIAENTGTVPKTEGENRIVFGVDPGLAMDAISFKTEGGKLSITVSGMGASAALACDKLIEKLETRSGDDVSLNEVISVSLGSFSSVTDALNAEWNAKADAMREKTLNTPNMKIPANKVVYYISPRGNDANSGTSPDQAWKTIAKLESEKTPAGCYVCFERGGIYRGKFTARAGVTYTAYGTGSKPEIWGSPFNGAEVGKWEEIEKNIWRYSEKLTTDVGVIVMNEGEAHGIKKILGGEAAYKLLTKNFEFLHELGAGLVEKEAGGYIYMYCDKGIPAELWEQIEFNTRGNVISVKYNDDVTIDNLCIMYGGSHGIGAGTVNNLKVTNCEVGWIGGSIQHFENGPVRFGNGIEIFGGCKNYVIDNCWVYQCYDAGITHQYSAVGTNDVIMDGVYYTNNLIEDCTYSIEYFLGNAESGNPTRYMSKIHMTDNLLRDAGFGFGKQRPDQTTTAHIKGWDSKNPLQGDYVIENNIMLGSTHMMVHSGAEETEYLPIMRNNIFAQYKDGQWGRFGKNPTTLKMYNYDTVSTAEYAGNTFYLINEPIDDQTN